MMEEEYKLAVNTVFGLDVSLIERVTEELSIEWYDIGMPTKREISEEAVRLLQAAIVGAKELSKTSTASNGYTMSSNGLVANAFHDRDKDTIVCKISYVLSDSTGFMNI